MKVIYVDIDESKIHGNIDKEDIDYAIQDYISKNHNILVKPLLTKIDLKTGKKIYDTRSALTEIIKDLNKKYF